MYINTVHDIIGNECFKNCITVGVLYGITNTSVGHPWDTLKTKMQAQSGYEKTGMIQTFIKTIRTQGIIGLYRLNYSLKLVSKV